MLVVGIQPSVGRDLQRRMLAGFAERLPGWRLSLRLSSWTDATGGLGDRSSDVAFVWLPVPDEPPLATESLNREERWVALRDFWLGTDLRPSKRPTRIAAEATSAEETFELIASGVGVALLSAGNARIYQRPGVVCAAVPDLPPSEHAWPLSLRTPLREPRRLRLGENGRMAWLAGIAGGFALLWMALICALWLVRPDELRLREALRLLPDLIRLLRRLAGDRSLPRGVRVRLWLLLSYLALPFDLVPDVIPGIGYADDAIIVAFALRSVTRRAGPEALRRHWPGTPDGLAALRRLAGLPGADAGSR